MIEGHPRVVSPNMEGNRLQGEAVEDETLCSARSSVVRGLAGWSNWLAVCGALTLTAVQAWAYFYRLDLSLGPRVILQPWLIEQGFVMYEQAVDIHSPLLPLLLAVLRRWVPDGLLLAKLALVGLLTCSTLLTFLAVQRRAGAWIALWAVLFFVCWSRSFGFGKLWHESLLTPLFGFLLWLGPPKQTKTSSLQRLHLSWAVLTGLTCGVALLVKQHAIVLLAACAIWAGVTIWREGRSLCLVLKGLALFSFFILTVLPLFVFAVYQYRSAKTLSGMLYWTVLYVFQSNYRSQTVLPPNADAIRTLATAGFLLPSAVAVLLDARRRGLTFWFDLAWGLNLLVAASVSAYPRFGFFHLQPALPVLAGLSALILAYGMGAIRNVSIWASWDSSYRIFAGGIGIGTTLICLAVAFQPLQLALDSGRSVRIWEYSELHSLAAEINARVAEADTIYIFPDDEATSNLYYLLRRKPLNYWIFHYPWYMLDEVQARILGALVSTSPQWTVYFPGRWEGERYASRVWEYIQRHYEPAATLQWTGGEVQLLRRRAEPSEQ